MTKQTQEPFTPEERYWLREVIREGYMGRRTYCTDDGKRCEALLSKNPGEYREIEDSVHREVDEAMRF